MNILVIDDLKTDRKLLQATLEAEGHQTFPACDGVEALAVLERQRIDALISDILMPRMDGYRLCYEVHKDDRFRKLPFIFYSSTYTSAEDEKLAFSFGGDAFLRKPSSTAQIVQALSDVLSKNVKSSSPITKPPDEIEVLKEYNQRLVHKLEQRNIDLTQRSLELQTTQKKLLCLLANTPAVIYGLKLELGKVIPYLASENITELLGFGVEETLSHGWWLGQLHPEDYDRAVASVEETQNQGASQTEYRIRHKNGTYRWVEDNRRLVRDSSNQPTELVGTWIDITDRKRTEEALQESELRFRQLADNTDEIFWMCKPDMSEILYISPAYEKVWGRTAKSLYASPRDWIDAIHADDRERVLQAIVTKLAIGELDEEYRIVRPDGKIRYIRDRAFPVRGSLGNVVRVAGIAHDITEHKELHGQLCQSQKLEAIGSLAGGIAHDFNNLLTVIQGYTKVAQTHTNLPEEVNECLTTIHDAGEQATGLTRQLLTFSRKQVIQLRPVQLNQMVQNTVKFLRRIIGEDIRLTTEIKDCLPLITADPGMVEQVLMNLCVNARDAMPKGGRLIIRTERFTFDASRKQKHLNARAGTFACLSVTDSGCGMSSEVMARIFEPFFTTKGVGKGTGLGLATVYGIAQQHEGWIEVESEAGKGATFRVFFPIVPSDATAQAEEEDCAKISGGTETILLVEDEMAVRNLVRFCLNRFGYRVLSANCGDEALSLWKKHSSEISMLLTDIVMPDGPNGWDLSQLLKNEKPSLKVVFTSGYINLRQSVPEFAMKEGVNFLQKPYAPNDLLKTIRASLDTKE